MADLMVSKMATLSVEKMIVETDVRSAGKTVLVPAMLKARYSAS